MKTPGRSEELSYDPDQSVSSEPEPPAAQQGPDQRRSHHAAIGDDLLRRWKQSLQRL
jgi:hypothetical protein